MSNGYFEIGRELIKRSDFTTGTSQMALSSVSNIKEPVTLVLVLVPKIIPGIGTENLLRYNPNSSINFLYNKISQSNIP